MKYEKMVIRNLEVCTVQDEEHPIGHQFNKWVIATEDDINKLTNEITTNPLGVLTPPVEAWHIPDLTDYLQDHQKERPDWKLKASAIAPVEEREMREAINELMNFCGCGDMKWCGPLYCVLAAINNNSLNEANDNIDTQTLGVELYVEDVETYYTRVAFTNFWGKPDTYNCYTPLAIFIIKALGACDNRVELVEHGSNDSSSWLTPQGCAFLRVLEQYVIKEGLLRPESIAKMIINRI